jgi:CO/xanthine dehydrogenase Mo-binding subunit
LVAYHVIGTSTPRPDGHAKVTGMARYTSDTSLPGTLWARSLRSPFPHARIVRIDTSKALALPGVHAALTGADVRGVLFGRRMRDIPVLAQDRARFAGERVAAVAADDLETAKRAIDLIDVEYEELPALVDPIVAMQPGAPLLHPDVNSYAGLPSPLEEPSNVFVHDYWGRGDIDAGFAQADLIVENAFTTPGVHQLYLEPHCCLVDIDDEGRVQVWAPNKAPHRLKQNLSDALGIPLDQIVVNPSTIGADFGGKGSPMDVPLCYFLALKTGRPVRALMDYTEELTAGNPRHASVIQMKTGVKRDGTITAHQANIIFNSGAYGGFKPVPGANLPGAAHGAGPYRIPNTSIEALLVYTNTIPGGFFRGPGALQTNFALESQMDIVARKLGMNPLELRSKNLLKPGEPLPNGLPGVDMNAEATLKGAIAASEYGAPKLADVGRGMSAAYKDQGEGQSTVAVTVTVDGSVEVRTSVFEQGTGSYATMQQIVAEELRVDPSQVNVEAWDTDDAPFDTGIGASRVTRVAGPAAYAAARNVRQELSGLAAELLGWPESGVDVSEGALTLRATGESHPWSDLLTKVGRAVSSSVTHNEEERSSVAAFLAQVAEVSVDRDTGQVRLLKITSAHDVAQVLNPIGHQGQINGGAIQSMGHGLMEDLLVSNGIVHASNLGDYKVPSIADVPEFRTALVQGVGGSGPYATKGIGEYSIEAVATAIANAVDDAVGVRITDLPVTAEKVYKALSAQKRS